MCVSCIASNDLFIQPWFLMTRWPSTGQEQYSLPPLSSISSRYSSTKKKWIILSLRMAEIYGIHSSRVKNWRCLTPTLVCKQNTFCLWLSSSVCFLSYTTRCPRWRNVFIILLSRSKHFEQGLAIKWEGVGGVGKKLLMYCRTTIDTKFKWFTWNITCCV